MTAVISNIRVLFVEIKFLKKGKLAQQNPITFTFNLKCVVGAIQTGITIMTKNEYITLLINKFLKEGFTPLQSYQKTMAEVKINESKFF